jgi:hypothetical protein
MQTIQHSLMEMICKSFLSQQFGNVINNNYGSAAQFGGNDTMSMMFQMMQGIMNTQSQNSLPQSNAFNNPNPSNNSMDQIKLLQKLFETVSSSQPLNTQQIEQPQS